MDRTKQVGGFRLEDSKRACRLRTQFAVATVTGVVSLDIPGESIR
jgi:hypothetical protein